MVDKQAEVATAAERIAEIVKSAPDTFEALGCGLYRMLRSSPHFPHRQQEIAVAIARIHVL